MRSTSFFSTLPTEQNNPFTRHIDRIPISQTLRLINREDAKVAFAVQKQLPAIERAVKSMCSSIRSGGRIFFCGAGTSGRLGVLEAAECPPTFNTPRSLVQAVMAGGKSSVFRSKEGAEDRGTEAVRFVRKNVRKADTVIGIAASGVTAYVGEALKAAKRIGANTVLVTCHSGKLKSPAAHVIAVKTGPEVIAGSTRLKAGTATKMVLNMLTVATMIQLGKVYGNRMVDLQPRSAKLHARAINLIQQITRISEKEAAHYFRKSGWNVKTTILMVRKKISRSAALKLLKVHDGILHEALK